MKSARLKKILVLSVSILLICASALYLIVYYINRSFVPGYLKGLAIKTFSEYTLGRAHIGSLQFQLKDGFVLEDIKIYDRSSGALLLSAERVSLRVVFIPSFKKHLVIIPSVNASGICLKLERAEDGAFNWSYLFKKASSGKRPRTLSFVLNNIYFEKSRLDFSDYYKGSEFNKTMRDLNGRLHLVKDMGLACSGHIDNSAFHVSGRYDAEKNELSLEAETGGMDPKDFTDYYLGPDNIQLNEAMVSGKVKCAISNMKTLRLNCDVCAKGLNGVINDIQLTGDYSMRGKAEFDIENIKDIKYLLDIDIKDAQFYHKDKTILKDITGINATLESTEKVWKIKTLSCLIYDTISDIYGEIKNPHGDFQANIRLKADLDLKDLARYANMTIDNGTALIDLNLTYDKDGLYSIEGRSDIERLDCIQSGFFLAGDFKIKGRVSGMLQDWQASEYNGDITFKNTHVSGMADMLYISDAFGQAAFSRDTLSIKNLQGTVHDTSISLQGDIVHKDNAPRARLMLKIGTIPLPKLVLMLPDKYAARLDNIGLTGECSVNLRFNGIINDLESHAYEGNINIRDATLDTRSWPYSISGIYCYLEFKDQVISWQNLRFKIADKQYSSYGKLSGLDMPVISAHISSDKFNALIEADIAQDNTISVSRLNGRYRDSTFSFKGRMDDLGTGYINASGTAYLNLKDLPHIAPRQLKSPENLKPKGTIKLDIDMKGIAKEPIDWIVFVQGSSENIYIDELTFNDFYMDYRMKDRFVDVPIISLQAYDGIINASMRANLKAEDYPFMANIDIKDIDLHKLIKDAQDKDKKIKGVFSARTVLNGYINRRDSLKGNGWIQVSDGYLWEFPVLSGIMDVLLMIPPEYIILTDAFGNFTIAKNRVYT
jgi:hypothetical protein